MLVRYDYETEYIIMLNKPLATTSEHNILFERITPTYVSLTAVKNHLISNLGDKTPRFFYTKVHEGDAQGVTIIRPLDPCEIDQVSSAVTPFVKLAINNAVYVIGDTNIASHGWYKVMVPH